MGKTKLLFEYKKLCNKDENLPRARMVLCREPRADKEKDIFDGFLRLECDKKKTFQTQMDGTFAKLDGLLEGIEGDYDSPVVVMFDEAQCLLDKGGYKTNREGGKEMEAFLFRLVRLWLCKKRSRNVVTTKLKKCIIKKDDFADELSQSDSQEKPAKKAASIQGET